MTTDTPAGIRSPLRGRPRRPRSWLAGGLLLLASLAATALLATGDDATSSVRVSRRSLVHDGLRREYLLHLPAAADGRRRRPLIIALHGADSSADQISRAIGLVGPAARAGFIVAYPDGTGSVRAWNAGYCCGDAPERGVDDVGFIARLIDELTATVQADPARVYVTGMSNGGSLAHRLAAELPERVAAIAPVAAAAGGQPAAGQPLLVPPPPGRPVAVLAINGRQDRVVPYDGGRGPEAPGPRLHLSARASIAFWAEHNGCPPAPRRTLLAGGAVVQEHYGPCRDGSEVVLLTVEDGGHDWPGATSDGGHA